VWFGCGLAAPGWGVESGDVSASLEGECSLDAVSVLGDGSEHLGGVGVFVDVEEDDDVGVLFQCARFA
jgi:hypothetical protein